MDLPLKVLERAIQIHNQTISKTKLNTYPETYIQEPYTRQCHHLLVGRVLDFYYLRQKVQESFGEIFKKRLKEKPKKSSKSICLEEEENYMT